MIDRIGLSGTTLTFNEPSGNPPESIRLTDSTHKSAAHFLMDWLNEQDRLTSVQGVGHRVVHGMKHNQTELVTAELLAELHRISPYDPEHLPGEIELIEAFLQRHPKLLQVACFDTAFHRTMPRVAKLLPIPRRYANQGVERYGFHGLSYAYMMEELARLGDPAATSGRVILAHLGNGASLAAVRNGKSIDTSMGFTPTAGVPMSTRSGDLDPGLIGYLAQHRTNDGDAIQRNGEFHESGLLGVSETSSDMRELLDRESRGRASSGGCGIVLLSSEEVDRIFRRCAWWIGHACFRRRHRRERTRSPCRICEGLRFLGIELEEKRNAANECVISTDVSRVTVHVIRTDEELMIARSVCSTLGLGISPDKETFDSAVQDISGLDTLGPGGASLVTLPRHLNRSADTRVAPDESDFSNTLPVGRQLRTTRKKGRN